MRILKFLILLILANNSLFSMDHTDDQDWSEMKLIRHPAAPVSVAIDIQPNSYSALINSALQEEKRLIFESETFGDLQYKIDALECPEIREKVRAWIDADIEELQETIQKTDTPNFGRLVQKYLGKRFNIPANKPLLTCTNLSNCIPLGKQEVFILSEDFMETIRENLANGTEQTYNEHITNFKRLQLYSSHLYPVARKRTIYTALHKIGLLATSLIYLPAEVVSSLHKNEIVLTLAFLAQITHLVGFSIFDYKTDYTCDQSADHIFDLINSLYRISTRSSTELTDLTMRLRGGHNAIARARLMNECVTLTNNINDLLSQDNIIVPQNHNQIREHQQQLIRAENYQALKDSLNQMYAAIQVVEK